MDSIPSDNPFQSPMAPLLEIEPTGPSIAVEGVLNTNDLAAAYNIYCINRRTIGGMVVVLFCGALLYCISGLGSWGWLPPLLFLCSGSVYLLILYWLAYYVHPFWRSKRLLINQAPQQLRLLFSESGVHLDCSARTTHYAWEQFSHLLADNKIIVLILKTGEILIAPARFCENRGAYLELVRKTAQLLRLTGGALTEMQEENPKVLPNIETVPAGIVGRGYLNFNELTAAQWLAQGSQLLLHVISIPASCGIGIFWLVLAMFDYWYPSKFVGIFDPDYRSFLVGSILCFAFAVVSTFLLRRRIQQNRRVYQDDFKGRLVRWIICKKSLTCVTNKNRQTFAWRNISKVVEKPAKLLLIHLNQQPICLPRRFFASDEDWRQVIAWARAKH